MTRKNEGEHIGEIIPAVLKKYQLKVLPANYNGITYSSTSEAKWAVFMDALGLPFQYEPEGYDLGNGIFYRPDFWIPSLRFWIEIKGPDPDESDCEKAHALAVASQCPVFVFYGGIVVPNHRTDPPRAYAFHTDGSGDSNYFWCECDACGGLGIQYEGRADRLACKECYTCWYYRQHPHFDGADVHEDERTRTPCRGGTCPRSGSNGDRGHNLDSRRLVEAYHRAWSWRRSR